MTFTELLQTIRDGDCEEDLDKAMAILVEGVRKTGKAGEITLKLKLNVSGDDKMVVSDDITLKEPKKTVAATLFFVAPGNALSKRHPYQKSLDELIDPRRDN